MTISLPDKIAKKVDAEAKSQGFATRSEFVRSLLRKYFAGETTEEVVFREFQPKSLKEIRTKFEKSGKYKKEFIDDLISGLAASSVYENKPSKH